MLRSRWSPPAIGLVLLMAVGSIVMWLGVPIGLVYSASRIADSSEPSLGPYLLVFLGLPVGMAIMGKLLGWLDRAHQRLTRSADDRPVQASRGRRCRAGEGKASGSRRRIPGVHVIVLGIDPGVANTGYGVVAHDRGRLVALDGGVIETAAGQDAGARLATIHERVGALMDAYGPDAVAIEDLYFGENARSAFAVGQARGVVVLAAGQRGVRCASYTPQQVKGSVCGSGRAAKDQVQRMVQTLLMLPDLPRPDHAADALAVAICHANGAPMAAALRAVS